MKKAVSEVKAAVVRMSDLVHIDGYYQRDPALIRRTDDNGKYHYFKSRDPKDVVDVTESNLETEIQDMVRALKVVEDAAHRRELYDIWAALSAIRQKTEERIHEIFRFVDQIGAIKLDVVRDNDINDGFLRYGQIVGASLSEEAGTWYKNPIYQKETET